MITIKYYSKVSGREFNVRGQGTETTLDEMGRVLYVEQ